MVEAAIAESGRTFGALFRAPYRVYLHWLYDRLANEGFPEVRVAHSAVFRTIPADGGRVTDMADAAGITKQSMGYLVGYLEEHGYVEMTPDPEDQRAKRVKLTKRGRQLLAASGRISAEFEREVASVVGERDGKELRRILNKLCDEVDGGWTPPK